VTNTNGSDTNGSDSGKKAKKKTRSVREKGAGMQKNRLKTHEGGKKKDGGRITRSEVDYLAAELHACRDQLIDAKNKVLEKSMVAVKAQKLALAKDEAIIALEARLLQQEAQTTTKANIKLREKHGLLLDARLHKDDDTGEVYYLEEEIKAAEAKTAAAKAAEAKIKAAQQ
jgi:hypothetical protein